MFFSSNIIRLFTLSCAKIVHKVDATRVPAIPDVVLFRIGSDMGCRDDFALSDTACQECRVLIWVPQVRKQEYLYRTAVALQNSFRLLMSLFPQGIPSGLTGTCPKKHQAFLSGDIVIPKTPINFSVDQATGRASLLRRLCNTTHSCISSPPSRLEPNATKALLPDPPLTMVTVHS